MPAPRSYLTQLTTDDGGVLMGIFSLPDALSPFLDAGEPIRRVAPALGIRLERRVDATELQDALLRISHDASLRVPRTTPESSMSDLIADALYSPIVIVEESPAVGKALGTLLTQGGAAYLAESSGSPFLLIGYEATVIVIWFVSGPVIGFREAAKEAAQTVGRPYFEGLFESLIHRRRRESESESQRGPTRFGNGG